MIGKVLYFLVLAVQINTVITAHFHHPPPNSPPTAGNPLQQPTKCNLGGWWQSDSMLTMYIIEDIPKSYTVTFDGYFFKNDDKKVVASILGARTKFTSNRDEGTFGLVVTFPAGGTAVWVGQCYHAHGKDVLQTLMLHRYLADKYEYWLATRIASQTWNRIPGPPAWYDANLYRV